MEKLVLTTKELMVLAAELDAAHFYGIRDPFFGVPAQSIRAEYLQALDCLQKKNIASLGFDDQFHVEPAIRQLVETCCFCDAYLTVDEICEGNVQPYKLLYFRGELCVLLTKVGDQTTLEPIDGSKAMELALSNLDKLCQKQTAGEDTASLTQEMMNKLSVMEQEAALAELKKQGFSEPMAKLAAAGLLKTASYCTIGAGIPDKRQLRCISFVYDAEGLLLLSADNEDFDRWFFGWITREELAAQISSALDR